jgi:hypothetical protein
MDGVKEQEASVVVRNDLNFQLSTLSSDHRQQVENETVNSKQSEIILLYSLLQYSTVQFRIKKYSTLQYSTSTQTH